MKLKPLLKEFKDLSPLKPFIKMAKGSKDGADFIKKAQSHKNVSPQTSALFFDMYGKHDMRTAAKNFVKDVKKGDYDEYLAEIEGGEREQRQLNIAIEKLNDHYLQYNRQIGIVEYAFDQIGISKSDWKKVEKKLKQVEKAHKDALSEIQKII